MKTVNNVLDQLVETVYNPTPGVQYLQLQAKTDLLRIIKEQILWGGKGGEPYPNDAYFIYVEQQKRLNELFK